MCFYTTLSNCAIWPVNNVFLFKFGLKSHWYHNMTLNNTLIDYLIEHLDNELVLLVGIPFALMLGFLNVLGSLGIIWHQKFGSDHKRTFLNKIVVSLSWVSITWFLLVHSSELLLYFYKPLPGWFCNIKYVLRTSIILLSVIYTSMFLIVKYIFIFWMKNPANFHDDFWSIFVNVWVVMFRYV